jgi:hypothetical protein
MSKFARKTAISAVAFATVGSALFGGAAMAGGIHNDGGAGGNGGTATNNCLNVGVPVLSGIAVGGTASAVGAQCTSSAGGGAGGAGAISND